MLAPTMRFYHEGTGYRTVNPLVIQYAAGTMGNMGYSSVQCASIPLEVGKLSLQCPYGTIGEIYEYGVNLSDDMLTNCANNDEINQCQPDSASFLGLKTAAIGKATQLVDYGTIRSIYKTQKQADDCHIEGESRLFVQYSCIQSLENRDMKYN